MKTFRIFFYWSVFGVALLVSIAMLAKLTSTRLLLLGIFAVVACLGYYTQEKINDWMDKRGIEEIRKFFKVKDVKSPVRIDKYRRFMTGVAITCLWGSMGIDLATMFISGDPFDGKINVPLYDLSLFLIILSLMPEIFWAFNFGVNDTVKNENSKGE